MKKLLFLLVMSCLFSCKETDKDRINRLVSEWSGKEIVFPNDMEFTSLGNDTNYLFKNEYTVMTYVDSMGCTGCKLKLPQWKELINELDSIGNTSVLFFLYPKNEKELTYLLKRDRFTHPVCIDENDSFNKLNHFPSDMMFQTFLLDKENKVVAIGNPIQNPRVKEVYLQIIMGDKAPKKTTRMQTTVVCPIATLDMGEFDWRQEQTGSFELTNTGNHPLVIIDAVTSCGCTSVVYDKAPLPPGKSTELKVRYKADHPEHFNKTISVHCNAEASPVKLSIKGNAR